ncbi:MAG: hypothetical protein AAGF12_14325, partial [Myxococcota bacterium]
MRLGVRWLVFVGGLFAFGLSGEAHAQGTDDWDAAEAEYDAEDDASSESGNSLEEGSDGPVDGIEAGVGIEDDDETEDETDDDGESGDGGFLGSLDGGGTFRLAIETALFFGTFETQVYSTDGFQFAPLLRVRYDVTSTIDVGAVIGFAAFPHGEVRQVMGTAEDGEFGFVFGDPMIEAGWRNSSDDPNLRIAVGLTAPVASVGSLGSNATLFSAIGANGGWDFWLWAEERLSVVLDGELRHPLLPQFDLLFDAGAAILFYTGDSDEETLFVVQAAAGAEWAPEGFGAGAQLRAVFFTEDIVENESFQLSVVPHAELRIDRSAIR